MTRVTETRVERDSLGDVAVPLNALYGAQTVRALGHSVGSIRLADRPDLLRGLAHVKAAAATANAAAGALEQRLADAIKHAASEVIGGQWHDQFPIALVHGGGGTTTNFAINEVLANRASQLLGSGLGTYDVVHPLDHVNLSQSSNDVYPTALQLAVLERAAFTDAALTNVAQTLEDRAVEFGAMRRLGRTCLQDAVAVPVDAYHGAQARAVRRSAIALRNAVAALHDVPLGATVLGTGVGAASGYRRVVVEYLAARTELPLAPVADPFDSLAHLDPFLGVSAATATAGITLAKIAGDLRFLASGPKGGIAEVRLPAVQLGSSIMPNKINPVIPERVIQASFELRGARYIVECAVAAAEQDVNVMEPVIARQLLESLDLLTGIADVFALRCLADFTWDADVVERHLDGSLEQAVNRASEIGHDAVEVELGLHRGASEGPA
jgi:aspartate ammonia-lyase